MKKEPVRHQRRCVANSKLAYSIVVTIDRAVSNLFISQAQALKVSPHFGRQSRDYHVLFRRFTRQGVTTEYFRSQ